MDLFFENVNDIIIKNDRRTRSSRIDSTIPSYSSISKAIGCIFPDHINTKLQFQIAFIIIITITINFYIFNRYEDDKYENQMEKIYNNMAYTIIVVMIIITKKSSSLNVNILASF